MPNKFGMSPLDVLELIGPMFIVVWVAIWLVVFGPLLMYPLARWKAHREQSADTQLGLKVALNYFAMLAFQLLLFGLAVSIYTLFSKSEFKGEMYRMGFAFLIPAGAVFAAHMVLLKRTNQDQYPGVRRLFLGYNLLVTGLIGFAALLYAFQVFFAKGSAGDPGRLAIASVLVYVGAWVALGVQFGRVVLGDHSVPPGPSITAPSSGAPVHASPQQSGPTLPSLSAGNFPPIDPK